MNEARNDELTALVERCDTLLHDLDLEAVVAWKEGHPGAGAVGCLPVYVPRELIHAVGWLPVMLHGPSDQLEIVRGDAWFQSYICQFPRGMMELAESGRLEVLDGFVFPAICDVIRNLSGIWKLMSPDRMAFYLDIPQNLDPEVGGCFYRQELERLLGELQHRAGRQVGEAELAASIAAFDANRAAIAELMRLRCDAPWKAPFDETWLVLRAADMLPVEEHTALVRDYLRLASAADRPRRDHTRVLLVGAFCEQPPLGLVRSLERAGCYVVWDDLTLGARFLQGPVGSEGDPLEALARAFLERATPCASVYDRDRTRAEALVERVRRTGAEGVVFAAPSFCDPALLDQPMLQAALDRAGVPWTAFRYAANLGQFQVIREQAGVFADSIRLWSEP